MTTLTLTITDAMGRTLGVLNLNDWDLRNALVRSRLLSAIEDIVTHAEESEQPQAAPQDFLERALQLSGLATPGPRWDEAPLIGQALLTRSQVTVSTACKREEWCCRQLGHDGECSPSFSS